jgi:hypothetical protein
MATWQASFCLALKYLAVVVSGIPGIMGIPSVHDAFADTALSGSRPNTLLNVALPEPSDFQTLLLGSGVAIVDFGRGYVFFCTNAFLSGLPPIPQSQCAKIGSVGTSTVGFTMLKSEEVNFFIINKTTDDIFQCVTTSSPHTGAPNGTCKQIGNIRRM